MDPLSFQTSALQAPGTLPRLEIILRFHGPFLVNDRDRAKTKVNKKKASEAYPRIDGYGRICLPATSIRGALRTQAERILRTLGHPCCGPGAGTPCPQVRQLEDLEELCLACQVFGAAGWRVPLRVSDFSATAPVPGDLPRQEFVAIDRFTGGAANKKKFDAERPDSVTLHGWIEVEPGQICAWGYGLLALVLRDLREGDIQFGLGRAKGYGSCTAKLVRIERLAPLLTEKLGDPGSVSFPDLVDKAAAALRSEVMRRNPEGSSGPTDAPIQERTAATKPTTVPSAPAVAGDFLNPYHFVPLAKPDLDAWHPADKIDANSALSHARYAPRTHSGRIICRLTAQTPLFIGNERSSDRETSTEGADEAEAK